LLRARQSQPAVYRGESQCRSLGYDVQAWRGSALPAGQGSASSCAATVSVAALGLFGDADGSRFHATYFSQNAGLWTHGDYIEFTGDGTARLHGRSDGVMNIRGIRIGPAEIYRVLQDIPAIREAMAVEQATPAAPATARMVLLVVLQPDRRLDGDLVRTIRRELGRRLSAAHVPEVIADVAALPVTHSGKRSERAAHDALNGKPLRNRDALRNPDCLELIRRHPALTARSDAVAPAQGGSWEARLQAIWERLFNLSPIAVDDNFFELGRALIASRSACCRDQAAGRARSAAGDRAARADDRRAGRDLAERAAAGRRLSRAAEIDRRGGSAVSSCTGSMETCSSCGAWLIFSKRRGRSMRCRRAGSTTISSRTIASRTWRHYVQESGRFSRTGLCAGRTLLRRSRRLRDGPPA